MDTITPNLPMSEATPSNFYYNGVGGLSYIKSFFNYPEIVFCPTARTNIWPVPSKHFVPEIKNGLVWPLAAS